MEKKARSAGVPEDPAAPFAAFDKTYAGAPVSEMAGGRVRCYRLEDGTLVFCVQTVDANGISDGLPVLELSFAPRSGLGGAEAQRVLLGCIFGQAEVLG